MIVDTTLLIDLEREVGRRQAGPATAFLSLHAPQPMRISLVTLGELAEAYDDPNAPELEEIIAPYGVVEITPSIARRYAAISRVLRATGSRLGDNDLWIAATALDAAEPLVTRDREHFGRVPGLTVAGY